MLSGSFMSVFCCSASKVIIKSVQYICHLRKTTWTLFCGLHFLWEADKLRQKIAALLEVENLVRLITNSSNHDFFVQARRQTIKTSNSCSMTVHRGTNSTQEIFWNCTKLIWLIKKKLSTIHFTCATSTNFRCFSSRTFVSWTSSPNRTCVFSRASSSSLNHSTALKTEVKRIITSELKNKFWRVK